MEWPVLQRSPSKPKRRSVAGRRFDSGASRGVIRPRPGTLRRAGRGAQSARKNLVRCSGAVPAAVVR